LTIQSEVENKVEVDLAVEDSPRPYQSIPSGGNKLSSLDRIRQQVSNAHGGSVQELAKQLTDEDLHQAWGLFTAQLREAKNHAAQSFAMAELRISDGNAFVIVVPNNIQQRFIESVRLELLEFLKSHFNNKS
jgi:DNA polymerase-3 subunit gamma/tau